VGPGVAQVVNAYLDEGVIDRLPTARRLLKLRESYGDAALEAACQRGLRFGDASYRTIKRILKEGLTETEDPQPIAAPAKTFVRSVADIFGAELEGVSWN